MTEILDIQNLSVGYKSGPVLLDCINLSVKRGELVALIGENGKGKTTFLRSLCGIDSPLGGTIMVQGKNMADYSSSRLAGEIGAVLTEKPQLGSIRVKDLISFGRYPFTNWLGIQREDDRDKVKEAMELCRITSLEDKFYAELSDGEKQKVMIARAIAQHTGILILDEPTSHLDISNKLSIMELLTKLSRDKGTVIIYSTHEIGMALEYSNRLWLIHEGKILDRTPDEVLEEKLLTRAFSVPENYFGESGKRH